MDDSTCAIVKIVCGDDWCWINQSDYDPSIHQLFDPKDAELFHVDPIEDAIVYFPEAEAEPPTNKLVDLNTATLEELTSIASIGINRARLIINNRPYPTLEGAIVALPDLPWATIKSFVEVK